MTSVETFESKVVTHVGKGAVGSRVGFVSVVRAIKEGIEGLNRGDGGWNLFGRLVSWLLWCNWLNRWLKGWDRWTLLDWRLGIDTFPLFTGST